MVIVEALGMKFPNDPEGALGVLRDKGYNDTAAMGFARAARSWSERDTREWKLWRGVEALVKGDLPEKTG